VLAVARRTYEPKPLHRSAGNLIKIGVVVSYAGVVVLRPALPHNTAYVDLVLAVMSLVALLSMGRVGSPATHGAAKAMPWMWLILLGSLLGMAGVGMAAWGVTDLAVSYFAFLTFFGFWHLVYVERLERYAVWGTAAGVTITVISVLRGGQYRSRGMFAQPNYPGHYLVMACIVLIYACKHWWAKALAVVALLIGINETGSFGAIAMVLAVVAVMAWRSLARHTAILVIGLLALVGGTIFYFSPASTTVTSGQFHFSNSLNSNRFQKSSSSRGQIWSDALKAWVSEPLGVGPAGVLNRHISVYSGTSLEVHADAISFLVERGPIGLAGYIGLWVVLWRLAKKGGFARLIIVSILVAGIFRETMHYRHVWLLLALAYVFDQRRSDDHRAAELAAAEQPPDEAAAPPALPEGLAPA
jgi:hypothetical protein